MSEEAVTTETTNATPPPEASAPAPAAAPSAPAPAASTSSAQGKPAAPVEKVPVEKKERSSVLREAMIAKGIIKPASPQAQAAASTAAQGQQPRDAQGKFVSPTTPPPSSQATPQASPAAVSLPRSLKRELEAHWKSAHPELQKAWSQRDADYDKGISTYRQQAQAAEALLAELRPYEHVLRATNTDARQTIRNLMPVAAVLATGTPQQKAAVMLQAMQQYGVPLEALAQAAQSPQAQLAADPHIQALSQQVQELRGYIQNGQQRSAEAENQRISAMAEAFGRDKPNFDSMRSQMWSLLQAQSTAEAQGVQGPLGAQHDTALWSEQQWIENAYNAAIRLDPNYIQSEISRQREEAARAERDRATSEARASQQAAVQVRGAPGGPANAAKIDPKDRRSVIAAAIRARV